MASEEQWRYLLGRVREAVGAQRREVAERFAAAIDAGAVRVIGVFPDGLERPESMRYRAEVRVRRRWVPVVDVPWMDVPGVVSADVEREAATARAQAQMGISPDTWPDDAA